MGDDYWIVLSKIKKKYKRKELDIDDNTLLEIEQFITQMERNTEKILIQKYKKQMTEISKQDSTVRRNIIIPLLFGLTLIPSWLRL